MSELRWDTYLYIGGRYILRGKSWWLILSPWKLLPLLNDETVYIEENEHFYPKVIKYRVGFIYMSGRR